METNLPLTGCTRCKELEKQVAELAAQVKRLASKLESKTRLPNMQTRFGTTNTTFTHGSRRMFRTNAKRHPGLLAIFATTKQNSLSISTIDKYHRPTTTRNKPFGQKCYFEKSVAATDPKKESQRLRP
jgi:hypothetical protein